MASVLLNIFIGRGEGKERRGGEGTLREGEKEAWEGKNTGSKVP